MKLKQFLVILFMVTCTFGFAQRSTKIDHALADFQKCLLTKSGDCKAVFKKELSKAKELNDTAYLNMLNEYAKIIYKVEGLDSSLKYNQVYLKEAIQLRNIEHQLSAYERIGNNHSMLSNFIESEAILEKGIALAKENSRYEDQVNLLIKLASPLRSKGDFSGAQEVVFRALEISKKYDYIEGEANVYRTLGTIYGMNRMFEKSLEYSLKASDILLQTKDSMGYCVSNINAANAAMSLRRLDTAEQLLSNAVDILRVNFDSYIMAGALVQLGRARYYNEDLKGTIKPLEEALVLSKNNGNAKQEAYIESILGESYIRLENGIKGLEHASRAYKLSSANGVTDETPSILKTLAKAYELTGNSKEAIKYYKLQSELSDSLTGARQTQKLLDIEKDYEKKIADEKLEVLKRDSRLKKWRNTGVIVFISMIALYSFLLVRKQRDKLNANRLIQKQRDALNQERLEKEALEKKQLVVQLEESRRQLISKALRISENNELLSELEQQLKMDTSSDKNTTTSMLRTIKNSRNHEKDWASFIEVFESVHPDYIGKIKELNKELTVNDIRLCSLEKMNLGTKQIAAILHISSEGVRKARYRLKKKLGIDSEIQVSTYLQSI